MANGAVITFAPLVFEGDYFFVLALLDHFGCDLSFAVRDVFAIYVHQDRERGGFTRFHVQKIDIHRVALGDPILPSASLDDCVGHTVLSGGEKAAQSLTEGRFWQPEIPSDFTTRNQENNLAFRRMRFEMRKQLGRGAAPKFFELFGKLARDTELSILEDVDRGLERFGQSVG